MNTRKMAILFAAVSLVVGTGYAAARAVQEKEPTKAEKTKKTEAGEKQKAKQHQATGTVISFSDTSLVISKKAGKAMQEWTFARGEKTTVQGTLTKDAKVTVFYHEENEQKMADRVKVYEAKPAAAKPAEKPKTKY